MAYAPDRTKNVKHQILDALEYVIGSRASYVADDSKDVRTQTLDAIESLVADPLFTKMNMAGHTIRMGPGKSTPNAFLGVNTQTACHIASNYPFQGADDMPATANAVATNIKIEFSAQPTVLHIFTAYNDGGWQVRDSMDVSAQIPGASAFEYDLTSHSGGGLEIRDGDSFGFYYDMTGVNGLYAATDALMNDLNSLLDTNYTAGVPSAGSALASGGLATSTSTAEFIATVKDVRGCKWTGATHSWTSPHSMPQFSDRNDLQYMFVKGLVVPDGETFTVTFQQRESAGLWAAASTFVMDMGATDKVSLTGAVSGAFGDVALGTGWNGTCSVAGATTVTLTSGNAYSWWAEGSRYLETDAGTFPIASYTDATHIEITGDATGATTYRLSEAGDTFDLAFRIHSNQAEVDVIWQNMRTGQSGLATSYLGMATRSYSNADKSAYGSTQVWDYEDAVWGVAFTRSGTADFDEWGWGRNPVVGGISSWAGAKATSTAILAASGVLSALETALSPSRWVWVTAVPGGKMTVSTSGQGFRERFGVDATDGVGDDGVPGTDDIRAFEHSYLVMEGMPNDFTAIGANGGVHKTAQTKIDELVAIIEACPDLNIVPVIGATIPSGVGSSNDVPIGSNTAVRRVFNQRAMYEVEKRGGIFLNFARDLTTVASLGTPYEENVYEGYYDTPSNPFHLTAAGYTNVGGRIADAVNDDDHWTHTPYTVT